MTKSRKSERFNFFNFDKKIASLVVRAEPRSKRSLQVMHVMRRIFKKLTHSFTKITNLQQSNVGQVAFEVTNLQTKTV